MREEQPTICEAASGVDQADDLRRLARHCEPSALPRGSDAAVLCGIEQRHTPADVLDQRKAWDEAACRSALFVCFSEHGDHIFPATTDCQGNNQDAI